MFDLYHENCSGCKTIEDIVKKTNKPGPYSDGNHGVVLTIEGVRKAK